MPQAIEAEQPGCAEPVRLTSTVRAVVTILSPIETPVSVRGSGVALPASIRPALLASKSLPLNFW